MSSNVGHWKKSEPAVQPTTRLVRGGPLGLFCPLKIAVFSALVDKRASAAARVYGYRRFTKPPIFFV